MHTWEKDEWLFETNRWGNIDYTRITPPTPPTHDITSIDVPYLLLEGLILDVMKKSLTQKIEEMDHDELFAFLMRTRWAVK